MESAIPPSTMDKTFVANHPSEPIITVSEAENDGGSQHPSQLVLAPIPITISPATPTENVHDTPQTPESVLSEKGGETREKDRGDKEKGRMNGLRVKRSLSIDRVGDTSTSKKVQQMLKQHVHKGRAGISAVSRKIGHGVSKHHQMHLRRTNSSPGTNYLFHLFLLSIDALHNSRLPRSDT